MSDGKRFEELQEMLSSVDPECAYEAIRQLPALDDPRVGPVLMKLLQTTDNAIIRNAVAISLAELGDNAALELLVRLALEPQYHGGNGTLIYAMQAFNCAFIVPQLTRLTMFGDFEASQEAFGVLEHLNWSRVSQEKYHQAIDILRDVLENSPNALNQQPAPWLEENRRREYLIWLLNQIRKFHDNSNCLRES